MYSSTTYQSGLGYTRTVTSPGRTYTTTVAPAPLAPVPVATTTFAAPAFAPAQETVTTRTGLYGSTVTRTFSPGRTYTTTVAPAPVPVPVAYEAPVATTTYGPYGA